MSLRILIAPTAYKGTASPVAVTTAIACGVLQVQPRCTLLKAPIADGGDGTVESVHYAIGGTIEHLQVNGPVGKATQASWWYHGDLAVVELASASGIALLKNHGLCPLQSHTFGTGQVLKHCLNRGFSRIVVCVGGSASTDGGAGLLCALGAKLTDIEGGELPLGGGALMRVHGCDLTALNELRGPVIQVATDVINPLLGQCGAARIYGPQKGANADQIVQLEHGLSRFADIMEAVTGRYCREIPGSGAAGGTAFGLSCGIGATVMNGFAWMSSLIQLPSLVEQADLVVTAEGCLDLQSLSGKAVGELAKLCQRFGKPLYCVPAQAQSGVNWSDYGFAGVEVVAAPGSTATSNDVSSATANLLRI